MKKVALNLRPQHQASSLTDLLLGAGIESCEFPTLELGGTGWDLASASENVSWIAVTSANAVRYIKSIDRLSRYSIAVIGESSAQKLRELGVEPRFISTIATASAFAKEFADFLGQNCTEEVLLLKGSSAPGTFCRILTQRGVRCKELVTYKVSRTEPSEQALQMVRDLLESARTQEILLYIIASSSFALRSLVEFFPELKHQMTDIPLIAIGPVTQAAAIELGFGTVHCSKESTMEGLLATFRHISN